MMEVKTQRCFAVLLTSCTDNVSLLNSTVCIYVCGVLGVVVGILHDVCVLSIVVGVLHDICACT